MLLVESSPCRIHTSARAVKAGRESPSVSGRDWRRPTFSLQGWKPAFWAASKKTLATALRLQQMRSPAHGWSAAWSHLATQGALRVLDEGMRRQCCKAVWMRSASQSQRREADILPARLPLPGSGGVRKEIRSLCVACESCVRASHGFYKKFWH